MDLKQIKQRKATESNNKRKILEFFPNLTEDCGIYIMTRYENDFKYAYVGQAKKILTRIAQHLEGYQHIDASIKKHGFYSEDNPTGWMITVVKCNEKELDEKEQYYIKQSAKAGYQLRNKTAGGQGDGKVVIGDIKPAKGYYDGLKQGEKKLIKEIQNLFGRYLFFDVKQDNKLSHRAFEKFDNILKKYDDTEIKLKYKGFEAVYYKDSLSIKDEEECFWNIEIYKDKKCLRHSTLGEEFSRRQILDYLKNFVDKET